MGLQERMGEGTSDSVLQLRLQFDVCSLCPLLDKLNFEKKKTSVWSLTIIRITRQYIYCTIGTRVKVRIRLITNYNWYIVIGT